MHTACKRAKAVALVDSGITKNFLNYSYTQWLGLLVKQLPSPHQLYNVDGTKNKAGELQHYTDLTVQTTATQVNMQFFLTDLGDHKAILGYPWFAMN